MKTNDNTIQSNELCTDAPVNRWHCTKLSDVRRRLVGLIQQMEATSPDKATSAQINYYRALVYAYATLAAVTRDAELDKLNARLDEIEGRLPDAGK
jgi:hypothetical protein